MSDASTNNRIGPMLEALDVTRIEPNSSDPDGVESPHSSIDWPVSEIDRRSHVDTPSNPPEDFGVAGNRPTPPTVPFTYATEHEVHDPFDPANLRLSQKFLATGGVKKHITTVPTRKPISDEWFQVHTAPDFTLDTLVLELKGSRECYLIDPALRDELATESTVGPRRLHVAINRDGTVFVWPLKLPPADGRQDRWSESSLTAAEAAKQEWVRLQADMGLGAYVYWTPNGELPPPQWPDLTFAQILKLAFKNNYIDSRDHLVLRRLRGEV